MHKHHNCEQMIETLSEYIDGNLRADLCADLEKHLHECERCTVVLNTMQKTVELYREIPEIKTDDFNVDIKKRLFSRLDLEEYLDQE